MQELRPVTKIETANQLKYSQLQFDMDEIDLFLQIGRKVIEKGRKSLQRLTKIEANLRELRMKYVVSTGGDGGDIMNEPDSDIEIPVNDLHLISEHKHEEYVFDQGATFVPGIGSDLFKSTSHMAKQD